MAERLPAEEQPSVLGEALSAARGIDDARSRAEALAAVAERLPAEEALAVARGIDDAEWRAKALAAVARAAAGRGAAERARRGARRCPRHR